MCLSYGPVYLRFGKSGEPNIFSNKSDKWKFEKIRYLYKSKKEICIYGRIMIKAYEAYKKFNKNNIDLISVHTLKPLDKIGISKY